MKISKRSLLSMTALVLTMAVTAFGTVAYMTDSDTVTNTFTVGNIDIIVDETNVDKEPAADGTIPERDQANEYDLIPGVKYVKDPTITVKANSEECYVRFRVTLNNIAELQAIVRRHSDVPADEYVAPDPVELLKMFVGKINECWDPYYFEYDDESALIEFRYEAENADGVMIDKVATSASDTVLPALFNTFMVPVWMDGSDLEMLNGLVLKADGDAVQTAAFDNADEAWEAYDYQVFDKAMTITADTLR